LVCVFVGSASEGDDANTLATDDDTAQFCSHTDDDDDDDDEGGEIKDDDVMSDDDASAVIRETGKEQKQASHVAQSATCPCCF